MEENVKMENQNDFMSEEEFRNLSKEEKLKWLEELTKAFSEMHKALEADGEGSVFDLNPEAIEKAYRDPEVQEYFNALNKLDVRERLFNDEEEVKKIKESWYTVKSVPEDVTPERLVEIFAQAIKEKNYDLYCDCIQPERRVNEIQQDLLLYFWDLHQERYHGEYIYAQVQKEETKISVVKGYDNSSANLDAYFLSAEDQRKIASHYGEKVEYASVQTVAFDAHGKQLGSPVRRNLIRTNGGRWYIRDYEMRF